MKRQRNLITSALLHPHILQDLTMLDWDLLIRQGRSANLLGRLAHKLEQEDLLACVPDVVRVHLSSALQMANRQEIALRWEVECIRLALIETETKIILLKGAAYVMAGLNVARGRTFSDVDILVPKSKLGHVESELMVHGWQGGHHDEYDQRYYRQWMHELPPMRHIMRGTTIDVHHTILPETARVKIKSDALFETEIALSGEKNLYVFQATDMLLHSATHLFHEGDFEKGLRDLFDLDSLLRQFSSDPSFWPLLVPRAIELGLTRPLFYALRYSELILETPIPIEVQVAAKIGAPTFLALLFMDSCYQRALEPVHSSTFSLSIWLARFGLYVRSHWIRMPFHLLTYHLGRKIFMRASVKEVEKQNAELELKM
ncbi:nucleotidyltransferase domain-containing protein [Undibacterium sp. Ren11W]|uniref:nucleotidyltransferase domain-containing protein n=1 Tax=Undibacterium sp. Ren11W TaxID=3413045 RepID=UPI003BF24D61